ncbi:MAG: helix-turn-helix transcriptional regulator [Sulfurimonas sp.]|nr:helix-turn-helix transcriptional regulator [Sulfurimonas sp.]
MYYEDVLKKCTAFNELDIDAKQQALADWLAGDNLQYLDCSKTQNIVKSTCQELGITQKELAEQLDVPQSTVSGWAKGDIPKMTKLALELMLENKSLKHKLQIFKEAHKIASEL